jgi:CheY-like chemotaxis protein
MLNILLIDDDEDEHLFFQWSIEKIGSGINLLGALSAIQAEDLLKHSIPDIIFLDINLPGADGFDCLNAIRDLPGIKNIPVFMYSTEITETSRQKAISLGAAGCLKKLRNHDVLDKIISEKLKTSATRHIHEHGA